jgi:hypothetical protein
MSLSWTQYLDYVPDSAYLSLYGFYIGSVTWKTGVYAGMLWAATRSFKWFPKWLKNPWQPSFRDSRTWMGLVIAATLMTYPLGGIAGYYLSLEQMAKCTPYMIGPH